MKHVTCSVGFLFMLSLPLYSQVMINEIMKDPEASSDSDGEWFELYNGSEFPVNLRGWLLRDGGRDRHVIDPDSDLLIPPGDFLVLGRSADSTVNGGYLPDYVYSGFLLSNGDDEIVLVDEADLVVDSVAYGSGWPDAKGVSMELISPGLDNGDRDSWGLAVSPFGAGDMGTPGSWNSIASSGIEDNRGRTRIGVSGLRVGLYPNPSDGPVTFRVRCPEHARGRDYTVEIFSMRGRLVRQMKSCCHGSLDVVLRWDGATSRGVRAPAGAYLVRIRLGAMIATGKFILTR